MDPKNPDKKANIADDSLLQNDELIIGTPGGHDNNATVTDDLPEQNEPTQVDLTTQSSDSPDAPKLTTKQGQTTKVDTFDMELKKMDTKIEQKPFVKDLKKDEKVIKNEEKSTTVFAPQKKSLLMLILKTFFILILSTLIFGGFILLDNFINSKETNSYNNEFALFIPNGQEMLVEYNENQNFVGGTVELKGGEIIKTQDVKGAYINLPTKGVLRLDQNTEFKVDSVNLENNEYFLTMVNGRIWGNTLNNFFDLKIKSGEIAVIPGNSAFEIYNQEDRTNIYSQRHDVLVEILAADKVINKLWIAEGNQAQFVNTKIVQEAKTIEQLLYSKLLKEFAYGKPSKATLLDNDWIADNIQQDGLYKKSIADQLKNAIREQGLKNLSTDSLRFQTKQIISDLRDALTFTDQKRVDALVTDIFENINDASFYYLQGNKQDADVRLSLFKDDIKNEVISQSDYASEALYNKLKSTLVEYLYTNPQDQLYPVKDVLFEELFNFPQTGNLDVSDQYNLLTLKLNDVYDSVESVPKDLDKKLKNYFDDYEQITSKYRQKLSTIKDEIIKQIILLDNLLLQTPAIYKLSVFESKNQFEKDYLNALTTNGEKQEQRQTFINEKINLLAKIKTFLFAEELDPADARQIVFRLITDIEELQEGTTSAAAINDLFEKRLDDFGIFWEYLKSDEYSSTPLYGDTHKERFAAFQETQKKKVTFEDIKEEILGTQQEIKLTAEDILYGAETELNSAGIDNIVFGFYKDTSNTKIPILSAMVSGVQFRATYDWNRNLLADIIVGDKLLSADGVKVTKAKTLIVEAVALQTKAEEDLNAQPMEDVPVNEFDEIFKAAKVFLIGKISQAGIEIKEESIRVVDLNAGLYEISDVYFTERKEIKFSFEYSTKDEKVTNVRIQTGSGERTVNNEFDLVFLDDIVFRIYDEGK